jgi:hypothetical protein
VLRGEILVAGSIVVVAAHLAGSSDAVFATMEYLISASGTVVVASKIGVSHLHWHLRSVHLRWLEKLVRL